MDNDTSGDEVFEYVQVAKKLSFGPPQVTSKSYVRKIAANTLKPGTYYVYAGYGAIASISSSLPKTLAVSSFGTETEIKVVVKAP